MMNGVKSPDYYFNLIQITDFEKFWILKTASQVFNWKNSLVIEFIIEIQDLGYPGRGFWVNFCKKCGECGEFL